jgi:hypothetical protein
MKQNRPYLRDTLWRQLINKLKKFKTAFNNFFVRPSFETQIKELLVILRKCYLLLEAFLFGRKKRDNVLSEYKNILRQIEFKNFKSNETQIQSVYLDAKEINEKILNNLNKENELEFKKCLQINLTDIDDLYSRLIKILNDIKTEKSSNDTNERQNDKKTLWSKFQNTSLGKHENLFYKLLNVSKHGLTQTILNADINGLNLNQIRQNLFTFRCLIIEIISDSSLLLSESVSIILKEILDLITLLIQSIVGFLIVPKEQASLFELFKRFVDYLNKF